MGLSLLVAAAVLTVGLLYVAGTYTASLLNAQQLTEEAQRVAERRAQVLRSGHLTIHNVTYEAPDLVVRVNNTGSVTFNLTKVDVVVNGALSSSNLSSVTVDGISSRVLPPAKQAILRLANPGLPSSVEVVSKEGVSAFWRG